MIVSQYQLRFWGTGTVRVWKRTRLKAWHPFGKWGPWAVVSNPIADTRELYACMKHFKLNSIKLLNSKAVKQWVNDGTKNKTVQTNGKSGT